MRVSMASGEMGTFSAEAIWARRVEVEGESRGLKRNLEQREARGSMILRAGSGGQLPACSQAEVGRVRKWSTGNRMD